jgi:outer membrane lipoprotein-sorting protein
MSLFKVLLVIVVFSQPVISINSFVIASEIVAAKLSAGERKSLGRIESYLDDIKTLSAQFLQVSSDGSVATGGLFMSRPGKIRFEYDPPSTILLASDGVFLIYIDKELEQKTHVWLSNTPIGFLTENNVKLTGDVTVTKFSMGSNIFKVTLVRTMDPEDGDITLIFSDKPLALRKWIVTDAKGIKTTISLNNLDSGVKIDPSVFDLTKFQFEN